MMTKEFLCLSTISFLLLSACAPNKISCADESGLIVLKSLVVEEAEKQLRSENESFPLSSIRATIAKIGLSFEGIRTSKNDPNSNKVFCEGKLTVSLPTDLIGDVQVSLRESGQDDNLERFLDGFNYQKASTAANQYQVDLVYNLQPTDDGKQIYAEIEDGASTVSGISSILNYALSKNILMKQKREERLLQREANHRDNMKSQSAGERGSVAMPQASVSEVDEMQVVDEMSIVQ